MPFTDYRGALAPDDLSIVQKIFDQLCKERGLSVKAEEQRKTLAREIVDAFQRGMTDEASLRQALSNSGASARRQRVSEGAGSAGQAG